MLDQLLAEKIISAARDDRGHPSHDEEVAWNSLALGSTVSPMRFEQVWTDAMIKITACGHAAIKAEGGNNGLGKGRGRDKPHA